MSMRITVKPEIFYWACKRAGLDLDMLNKKFPKLRSWVEEKAKPTLKQLEKFAKTVFVPVGYLFLDKPPVEDIPIPDFRTIGNEPLKPISRNLLDLIYLCQRRQIWYSDWAKSMGENYCKFINSINKNTDIKTAANKIRKDLDFDLKSRKCCKNFREALRLLIDKTECLGILVMVSGIVGSNNHRKLSPNEFRGFALVDKYAPVIFVNGSDTKAAQIFTLAHEIAHLWLGESAISNADIFNKDGKKIEQWCNKVAAELLVPTDSLKKELDNLSDSKDFDELIQELASKFKVSTLVIIRRIFDIKKITKNKFKKLYDQEINKLMQKRKKSKSGGNYYYNKPIQNSRLFIKAIIASTLEGKTLYRDAFKLLGVNNKEKLIKLGKEIGVKI